MTSTQFAYNNVGFLSYDDPRAICDKTEYAMDEDLNGYIIWEISGDLLPDLRTPLLDAMDDRLKHPGVRCKSANYGSGNPGPANDGAMHQSDDAVVTTGAQWYPNQASLGTYCVNDGKRLEYYVAPDQIYPSAEKCCQKVYKHESNCVHYSMNPGSDGGYIDDGSGNPWYPHPDYKYCRNDGDQKTYFIFADQQFVSVSSGLCALLPLDPLRLILHPWTSIPRAPPEHAVTVSTAMTVLACQIRWILGAMGNGSRASAKATLGIRSQRMAKSCVRVTESTRRYRSLTCL